MSRRSSPRRRRARQGSSSSSLAVSTCRPGPRAGTHTPCRFVLRDVAETYLSPSPPGVMGPGLRRDALSVAMRRSEATVSATKAGSLRRKDSIRKTAIPDTRPPSRDALRPSSAPNLPPKKSEGVGNAGCPLHPQPRVQKVESTRVSTADTPEHPAFPHAMVLTVSFALSLVTGLVCHHRRRNEAPLRARLGKGAFRRLDASVGASGPHDYILKDGERPLQATKPFKIRGFRLTS